MDDIFRAALEAILEHGSEVPPIVDPTSPHSRFGASSIATREVRNWSVSCGDVRSRLLGNPARNAWLDQAIGMALWQLRATDRLDEVSFYNPNAARFSDDGETIRAPWGPRILGPEPSSGPLARALDLLARDRSSLRAVIPVFERADLGVASRDVPCLLAIHLLVRDGRLHATCILRSLNPYWVWAYDHFFLTLLIEFSAARLGVAPGGLAYVVSSLQVDATDLERVREAVRAGSAPPPPMPPMGAATWSVLREVGAAEPRVRELLAEGAGDAEGRRWTEALDVPDAWWRALLAALAHAHLARRDATRPRLPFPCPGWAEPFVARAAEPTR